MLWIGNEIQMKEWKAHDDFIRGLDVNEMLPYILTCGDDMLIKLWDWEHDFQLVRVDCALLREL